VLGWFFFFFLGGFFFFVIVFRNKSVGDLFHFLLSRAAIPYFNVLKEWLYKGRIDDPWCEFFIRENDIKGDEEDIRFEIVFFSFFLNVFFFFLGIGRSDLLWRINRLFRFWKSGRRRF